MRGDNGRTSENDWPSHDFEMWQGRFSGRLQHKADEQGLILECATLGPLLGGSLDPDDAGRSSKRQENLSVIAGMGLDRWSGLLPPHRQR